MKLIETLGAASRIWQIFIADSSSTTGAGLTGLVFNTAGLTAYYHRDTDTTATVMTLVTMTVGTFTSLGFKEIDATNMPGWYQFCPPNAALASGAKSCGFLLKGATNMAPLPIEVQLVAYDTQDAVRLGLTALPNATAGANTGLPVVGTQVPNATAGAANGLLISGTNSGTTTLGALTVTGALTISDGLAVTRSSANTSAATFTGNGTGSGIVATSGAGATGDGIQATAGSTNGNGLKLTKAGSGNDLAATSTTLVVPTVTTTTTATNLTNAPTAGDFTAAMKTSLNAATPAVTVSDKTGFALTSAYDAAKTASQAGDVMKLSTGTGANQINLTAGNLAGAVPSVTAGVTLAAAAIDSASLATSGKSAITTDVWAGTTRTLTGSQGIKKNTAKAGFPFAMTDSTNHNPATGLTVTAQRSLDGASFAGCANAVVEVSAGWYKIDLAAADLNGDTVALKFTATGADQLNVALVTSP